MEHIATPSVCLYRPCSKMKNDSYAAKVKSSLISLRSKLKIVLAAQNKSIQMSITSFKEKLVNKLPTSRLVKKVPGQKLETASENESCTENLINSDR